MPDESEQIGQDEIEELLRQSQSGASAGASETPPEASAPADSSGSDVSMGQDDIEALLNQTSSPPPAATPAASPAAVPETSQPARTAAAASGDIDLLLQHAEQALASVDQPVDVMPAGIAPFSLDDLTGSPASSETTTIDLIRDVELSMRIELGRTMMYLEDVLQLRRGSVVPLDKLAGDPVDIFVNGRIVARGEVLVLNDNFCVRVAELLSGDASS